LNRLVAASVSGGPYDGMSMAWNIDSFGNRSTQLTSGHIPPQATPGLSFNNGRNRADQFIYDAAGNVTNDGVNQYAYDAEGRICAVNGAGGLTGYLYDAEGRRVAKGTLTSFSCDLSANGFTATERYMLGQGGEQLVAVNGSGNWEHTNVFAGGKLLGTYDAGSDGFHYAFSDWLGTKRAQYSLPHGVESLCSSLPYGDSLSCTGSDATNYHYTNKERDAESGNDYFGARYYASGMGRFMSPDWSAKEDPVPYAKLDNPQSLNLYGYVQNNPLTRVDADGHQSCTWCSPWWQFTRNSLEPDPGSMPKPDPPMWRDVNFICYCQSGNNPFQAIQTFKKWYDASQKLSEIAKGVKSAFADKTEADKWREISNTASAAIIRDSNPSSPGPHGSLFVDYATQRLAAANLEYLADKQGTSILSLLGNDSPDSQAGEGVVSQAEKNLHDARQNYREAVSAWAVQNGGMPIPSQ
jgi:RHS repeat-associated protein